MISQTTEKIIKQFKKANLSIEDRVALTTALLYKLQSLPLESTFIIDSKGISVNGKVLEPEQVINFTESCAALKDNFARKVIHEQIRYLAVNMGIHNSLSIDTLMFAKAALWCLSQEEDLLAKVV